MAEQPSPRANELERELLVRCKELDPQAFRAFVVRYERAVFALLSRLLGHGPHVDDLAQEAFLRAFRAFPRFDLDASAKPSTWLLTIATRLALDHRKRATLAMVPLDAAGDPPASATPESDYGRLELGVSIARAAAQLPEDQRVAFVLAEFHGLSISEIAEVVGAPETTVRTRLFRAREKLRDALEGVS